MKTRRSGAAAYLALLVAATFAASCGTRISATEESAATPAAGTNAPAATEEASSAASETPAVPAIPRSARANVPLRPELQEVVRLVDSGAGEEVVKAYVGGVATPYELGLEEIIYLRDIGISDAVIASMMRRSNELRDRQAETATMQTNLVSAVEELREAVANRDGAPAAGTTAAAPTPPAPGATPAEGGPVTVTTEGTPSGPPVAATSAQVPVDAPAPVQQFYSPLASYGTWYQTPSYGWVWQPTVVVANPVWMPYRHGGRWMWTDCGWYWCSDYSWGWAPFHYGRWCTYPGLGWCWVPDTTWGPSWVTWRYSSSHLGWAPLPPGCGWRSGVGLTWHGSGVSVGFEFGLASSCYTFVGYDRFCHRSLQHHVLDHEHARVVYQQTTVINHVVNGDHNVIINHGPGYSQVASRVRDEVPKAHVQPLPDRADRTLRADRVERSHDGNVIYRPVAVESTGGRPVAMAPEVRPSRGDSRAGLVSSTPSPVRSGPGQSERPGYSSRFGESSGRSTPASSAVPNASRPTASYGTRSNPRGPVANSGEPKAIETRNAAGARGAEAGAGAGAMGPRRQTMPVPLGDPSRNLPMTGRSSSSTAVPNRFVPSAATPNADPVETRTMGAGGPSGNIPAPAYSRPNAAGAPAPFNAPRAQYSAPNPVLNAPRPNYAPSPSPSVSAPRPAYSAPSPAMSAPRPSFTPPVSSPAPSMAPRSAVSTPSSVGASPQAGGSGGRGNNGSRQNPN